MPFRFSRAHQIFCPALTSRSSAVKRRLFLLVAISATPHEKGIAHHAARQRDACGGLTLAQTLVPKDDLIPLSPAGKSIKCAAGFPIRAIMVRTATLADIP